MRRTVFTAAADDGRAGVDPALDILRVNFGRQVSARRQLRHAADLVPALRDFDKAIGVGAERKTAGLSIGKAA